MAPEKDNTEPAENSDHEADTTTESEHDPVFEPIVTLPEVEVKTFEEGEDEMLKLRCKLYRYHMSEEADPEWKERGTGDIKILRTKSKKIVSLMGEECEFESPYCRVLMRQDKTLKIRANHYITGIMELRPNCGSDRAWVWSVAADFADEEPKRELFAARFANPQNAQLFKEKFDEAKAVCAAGGTPVLKEAEEKSKKDDENVEEKKESEKEEEKVADDLEKLTVKETEKD